MKREQLNSSLKLFVLGYGRSGTTMMGHILGNHPDVYMFKELNFFEKLWNRTHDRPLTAAEAQELAARLIGINREGFGHLKDHSPYFEEGRAVISELDHHGITPISVYKSFLIHTASENNKRIPCEQTPGYVFFLDEILGLFPEAKIINMIRDPRDVLVSRKKKWRQNRLRTQAVSQKWTFRTWVHYHPISSSILWTSAVQAAQPYIDSGLIHQVKFERLLTNPEEEIKKVCDFIGITYHDEMQSIPIVGSSFLKESPVPTGIDKTRTANWRNGGLNSAELFINQKISADCMKRYDYRPAKVFPNPFLLIFYLATLPLKMMMTLFAHKNHFKNMKESIRKRLPHRSAMTGT